MSGAYLKEGNRAYLKEDSTSIKLSKKNSVLLPLAYWQKKKLKNLTKHTFFMPGCCVQTKAFSFPHNINAPCSNLEFITSEFVPMEIVLLLLLVLLRRRKKKKSITKACKIPYYISIDRKRGNTKSVRWLWTAWTDIAAAPCWHSWFDLTSARICHRVRCWDLDWNLWERGGSPGYPQRHGTWFCVGGWDYGPKNRDMGRRENLPIER